MLRVQSRSVPRHYQIIIWLSFCRHVIVNTVVITTEVLTRPGDTRRWAVSVFTPITGRAATMLVRLHVDGSQNEMTYGRERQLDGEHAL